MVLSTMRVTVMMAVVAAVMTDLHDNLSVC